VRPPGRCSAKLILNSRKGIFLGFIPNTDKNIIWYDTETHVVKIAKHVRFDEGMNNLPPNLVPPNVVHLQCTQNGEPLPVEVEETLVNQFTFHLNPFPYTMVKGVQVTDDDPSYGLTLASNELNHRAYVTDVKENSTADKMYATHKSTLKNVKGAYSTLLASMESESLGKTMPSPYYDNCMTSAPKISSLNLLSNASSPPLKHGALQLNTTSWNSVLFMMLIIIINSCLLMFAASPQSVIHTLISPSPHSPPKKWKWSYRPFNLKLSPQLSKPLAVLLDVHFVS